MREEDEEVNARRVRLRARVERVTNNTLTPGSKKSYTGSLVRYLSWLHATGETLLQKHILSDAFREGIVGSTVQPAYIKAFLARKPRVSPIDFANFQGSDFTFWLADLQDEAEAKTGKPLTQRTMGGHRSALRFLFRQNNQDLDGYTDEAYHDFFSGLKRDTATVQGRGHGKVLTGKVPLSFQAYEALSTVFLTSGAPEDVFAHTFLVLQWNLMCRSANTSSICFSHVAWRNDAIGIVFPRMKNDQSGERPREPRHVYANPTMPSICPVLSLAIYFVCFPTISTTQIFPGDGQSERFRKRMHLVLSRPPLSTLLIELGLSPDDIGTHSIRKGSATYCSSGSTACPTSASVRTRAGWSTGAVHEVYCQYEAAGDQHVGRTASGLPVDKPEFAVLPPHFSSVDDTVLEAVRNVYPALHSVAPSIALFCFASLLYHDQYLSVSLPHTHPLRHTQYFQNHALKSLLMPRVRCEGDCNMRPTGVPPHVNMLVTLDKFATEIRALAAVVTALPAQLEARATAAPNAQVERENTRSEINAAVRAALQDSGALAILERLERSGLAAQPERSTEPAQVQEEERPTTMLRVHRGRLARGSEPSKLPDGTLYTVWEQWFCGRPPLRFMSSLELPTRNERKRLSDLKYVMTRMLSHVPGFPRTPHPTSAEAYEAFKAACSSFELSRTTPAGRARRIDQIRWTSVVTLLREQEKQR